MWAKISKEGPGNTERVNRSGYLTSFHAPDGSRLSQQSHFYFELKQPFTNLVSAAADEFWAAMVFYLVEKGHFGRMAVQLGFLNSLKAACARVANISEDRGRSTPVSDTFSLVEESPDADETDSTEAQIEAVSTEDEELDAMERIKSEMEVSFGIKPKKLSQGPPSFMIISLLSNSVQQHQSRSSKLRARYVIHQRSFAA